MSFSQLRIIEEKSVEIGDRIGGGGFGTVHKGKWMHNAVAVKLLTHVPLDDDAELKETIEKEAKLIASLFHPNITKFFGLLSSSRGFVMELMEGSLYDAIRRGDVHHWPIEKKVNVIKGAASGLTYLHENDVLHRDLKSMNILLSQETAKLTDFGLSKIKEHTANTMTGFVGTFSWMAPEVLKGDGKYGKPSDIYSLSLVLWEILHEEIPFKNLNLQQIILQVGLEGKKETIDPETPKPMQELMEDCWKDASSRPTALEFLNILAIFIDTLPEDLKSIQSSPPSPILAQGINFPRFSLSIPQVQESGSVPQVPKIAFGARDWETYFGNVDEEPPLPPNIEEILQSPCPFWPNKKVAETHFLSSSAEKPSPSGPG